MIHNTFINEIIDLLLGDDKQYLLLRQQLPHLEEMDFVYTGSGLFVYFNCQECVDEVLFRGGDVNINGVDIKSSVLQIGATAILFVTNGVIDYLEIWSYGGDYPQVDLPNYELMQIWNGSPGKRIIKM